MDAVEQFLKRFRKQTSATRTTTQDILLIQGKIS